MGNVCKLVQACEVRKLMGRLCGGDTYCGFSPFAACSHGSQTIYLMTRIYHPMYVRGLPNNLYTGITVCTKYLFVCNNCTIISEGEQYKTGNILFTYFQHCLKFLTKKLAKDLHVPLGGRAISSV